LARILAHGTCKLYKISNDKNEYKRLKRTLSKENKLSDLNETLVNDSLMGEALKKLSAHKEVYILHDPSDIRKPHSNKTENIGKVRDLNNKIINGYSSHNIVAVTPKDKTVHLLSHQLYSNKDPRFLKAEYVKKIELGKEFAEKEAAVTLYESQDWFNKKTLTKKAIKKTNKVFKEKHPELKITHVLDREFDDDCYFSLISELGDDFVIRAKKTRTEVIQDDIEEKKLKLIASLFEHKQIIPIQKIRLKKRIHQDVTLHLEWKNYQCYRAVKITLRDREDKEIFTDPMLLITNKKINTPEEAHLIYQIYLKRSRIECVFKFLKEGLGWEDMQLQDFQGIQNLLSICFFVAAYLYEIKEQEVQDDYVILLSKLGGGKGIVSRHYILKGIHMMMAKLRADRILKEEKVSADTMLNILALAGVWEGD
jgi:hypothetical protein